MRGRLLESQHAAELACRAGLGAIAEQFCQQIHRPAFPISKPSDASFGADRSWRVRRQCCRKPVLTGIGAGGVL